MNIVGRDRTVGAQRMYARHAIWTLTAVVGAALALAGAASATPPARNELGASFRLVSKGPTNVVEIRLRPKAPFDTVAVEAASGVESLTPPCSFSGVVPGGSYVCRVSVSHKATAASLTVNVVGQRRADPAKPPLVEVRHYTIGNAGYVARAAKRSERPAQNLLLTPPPGASK